MLQITRVAGSNPRDSRQFKVNQAGRRVDNFGDGAKEGEKAITTYLLKNVEEFHEEKKKDK